MLDIKDLITFLKGNLKIEISFKYSLENERRIEFLSDLFNLEFGVESNNFIIENFNVHKPKNGSGSQIINSIIYYLSSNGFEKIILESVDFNVYLYFWKKLGFIKNENLYGENYYLEL